MQADVLQFSRGVAMLRSPETEAARMRRIQIKRQGAFTRATRGDYAAADQAMFGPVDKILEEGPGIDPRLVAPLRGGPAVA